MSQEESTHKYLYGGLEENDPTGRHFNTWSPTGRTIWEGLGDVGLLEEVYFEVSKESCLWFEM